MQRPARRHGAHGRSKLTPRSTANRGWRPAGASACLIATMIAAIPALAQTVPEPETVLLSEAIWLGSSDRMADLLTSQPPEYLRSVAQGGRPSFLARLGKLAFRSPFVLGGRAGRLGLSCNTCHTNGGVNADFFVDGLSDRPGGVDASHAFWNRRADDGLFNPVNIPSLRGVRLTAPYGRDGRFAGLDDFTRRVIVTEFGGDEPEPLILDALVSYQLELAPPAQPPVGRARSTRRHGAAAGQSGRGAVRARLLRLPPPRRRLRRRPPSRRGDGWILRYPESARPRRVGALLSTTDTPLIWAAVVDHFDDVWALGYGPDERRAMIAYLKAVGAVDRGREPVSLAPTIHALQDFATLLMEPLESEDAELADFIADMVRLGDRPPPRALSRARTRRTRARPSAAGRTRCAASRAWPRRGPFPPPGQHSRTGMGKWLNRGRH